MDKQQAQQEIEAILKAIIPTVRLINSSTVYGQTVAELRWTSSVRYLPIIDNSTVSSQVTLK